MTNGRPIRNVALYLGFSIATSAIGFGAVMILVRLLEPTEYGLIGVFLSMLFFVAPLVSLSADGLIAVNKTTLDNASYLKFQRNYISLAYVSFLILQLLFLLAWVGNVYSNLLFAAAPLLGLVRFLAGMASTEYVAEQRPIAFGVMTVLTAAFSVGLTVALISLFGNWGGWRIVAMLGADLLMLAVRYHGRLNLLFQCCWQRESISQILRFGIPGLAAVAGGWALNESDKLVIAHFAGLASVGVYAAASALAAIMMTFNQSLTNALYPQMFRTLAAGAAPLRTILIRYTTSFVGLSMIFSALVIGGYFMVADMLLPARYLGSRDVFIALVLSSILVSFYRPFGLMSEYFKLARIRAAAILSGGATTIVVAYLGVPGGGLLWAPAGIASGYFVAAVVLGYGLDWNEKSQ